MISKDSWLSNDILDILGIPGSYVEHEAKLSCDDMYDGSSRISDEVYIRTDDGIIGSIMFYTDLYGKKFGDRSTFAVHMNLYFRVGDKKYRSEPKLLFVGKGDQSWDEAGFQKAIRKELAPMRRIIKRYIRKSRAQKQVGGNIGKLAVASLAGYFLAKSK